MERFTSPQTVALARGAAIFVGSIVVAMFTAYMTNPTGQTDDFERWKWSFMAGIVTSITPFVGRAIEGARDQSRAATGKVIAGDVPVHIEAAYELKRTHDVGPGRKAVSRTPAQIAASWTRRAREGVPMAG